MTCVHINGHVSIVGISIFAYRSHLFPGTLNEEILNERKEERPNVKCKNKATTNHSILHAKCTNKSNEKKNIGKKVKYDRND